MRETIHKIRSAHLGNERTVWVRLSPDEAKPVNLVIFLDAELYRDRVGATAITDRLSDSGEIAPTAFVFVSMHSMEARSHECPCYPPFARFVLKEFLPWLENLHPELRGCRERVLVGLSYTGLAAAYVALQDPNAFTKVIAQSGSFWWNDCWLVNEYAQLKARLPVEFYLDVGNKEIQTNVDHGHVRQTISQIDGVQRFRDLLTKSLHTVNYAEFDGHHDAAQWRETLPGALKWALLTPYS
jgi:enterochelin esterase-like enzyme